MHAPTAGGDSGTAGLARLAGGSTALSELRVAVLVVDGAVVAIVAMFAAFLARFSAIISSNVLIFGSLADWSAFGARVGFATAGCTGVWGSDTSCALRKDGAEETAMGSGVGNLVGNGGVVPDPAEMLAVYRKSGTRDGKVGLNILTSLGKRAMLAPFFFPCFSFPFFCCWRCLRRDASQTSVAWLPGGDSEADTSRIGSGVHRSCIAEITNKERRERWGKANGSNDKSIQTTLLSLHSALQPKIFSSHMEFYLCTLAIKAG